ncbi:MAG: hypothetical protein C0593_01935 [Marinilabiliales bacterium]|nr:MAG: hypothetical protein C0593_01935 [Marinilabiliales bacterium]
MKSYKIFLFLISLTMMFSCTKTVEFKGEVTEPMLVVNSIINPDSAFKVHVTKSRFFLDDAPISNVESANVRILKDDALIAELSHTVDGIYTVADITPEAGQKYQIEVSAPGYDDTRAEAMIPTTVAIASLDTATVTHEEYWDEMFEIGVKINDPANTENFYRVSAYLDSYIFDEQTGDYWHYRDYIWLSSEDPVITGGENSGDIFDVGYYNEFRIFNDSYFEGQSYTVKFMSDRWQLSTEHPESFFLIHVYLESLSEEYFTYLRSRAMHNNNEDNPFVEPVPVYSNIENGIGFFGGYASSHYQIRHEGYQYYWEGK